MPRLLISITVALVLGSLGFSPNAFAQGNQSSRSPGGPASQKSEAPDLRGAWVTDEGEEVELSHLASSGHVTSVFEATNQMLNGGCAYDQPSRSSYIDGSLAGNVMTGKMTMCTGSEVLVDKCHLGPSTVDFTATVTKDRIEGTRVSEWYKQNDTNDPCKFTHEPARDTNVVFSLTRKQPSDQRTSRESHHSLAEPKPYTPGPVQKAWDWLNDPGTADPSNVNSARHAGHEAAVDADHPYQPTDHPRH